MPPHHFKYFANAEDVELDHCDASPTSATVEENMDDRDMARLGRPQVLIRQFKPIALAGFTIGLAATWPYAIISTPLSLTNGGPAGAIWMLLIVCFGQSTVVLSLAHASSMAPHSGGPYHYVSEFAPPKHQQLTSYLVGWFDLIGWQAGTAGTAYFVGSLVLALAALVHPAYVIQSWHVTITCIFATALAILGNGFVKSLPWIEGALFLLQTVGFAAVLVILLVLGPKTEVRKTFVDFQDNAGWGNVGLSTLVGVLSPFIILSGADSTAHLAEETQQASKKVPRVMIWSMLFSYPAAFIMTVVIMVVSTGYDEDVARRTGQDGIAIILNATRSMTATVTITIALVVILFFGLVNQITVASRVTWAFARDKGLPFPDHLAKISPRFGSPVNALILTFLITAILSLFPLASRISVNIITSLSLIGLLCAYFITIFVILHKRIFRPSSPFPPAHLRIPPMVANALNMFALCFLALVIVMMFFPSAPHPTAETMNWTIVVLPTIMIIGGTYFRFKAIHTYQGPIAFVKRVEAGNWEV